jgi:hypothetical protein
MRAWAGQWRVSHTLGSGRWTPTLIFDYNYATGDENPADGRQGTFELLYPTPHDRYGLADQVGWRNIHHSGNILEWRPFPRWTWQTKYHAWWLASETDGVYTAGGALIARDPTGNSGRFVGHEIDLQAFWSASEQVQLRMGLGHIFPGEFLQRTTPAARFTFPYVMLTITL